MRDFRASLSTTLDGFTESLAFELAPLGIHVTIIEPLVRAAPVPREHEDGIREVSLLRSMLEPVPVVISAHVLYVADDMVQTGAAFAAFSTALADRWPGVRPV